MKILAGFAMFLAFATPFSCLANSSVPSPPQDTANVTLLVPAGTAISVHVVGTVSSASAKSGDVFQMQAAQDVVVSDMVVVRKGAQGQGHVVESDSAGGNGHSGAVGLAFDYIYAADGGRIKLSDSPQKQAEEDRKGASSTATIIGFATFGIGGLFGHNLAHGRQKTIDEKMVMSAFVAENVHVDSGERSTAVRYDHQSQDLVVYDFIRQQL